MTLPIGSYVVEIRTGRVGRVMGMRGPTSRSVRSGAGGSGTWSRTACGRRRRRSG
ncbi:hypothetical protein STANM309S_05209 [Streptomyces tanashiensis]